MCSMARPSDPEQLDQLIVAVGRIEGGADIEQLEAATEVAASRPLATS
jgi:hypothetical protein